MYGCVLCWVSTVFVRCFFSKGDSICTVMSLFLGVGFVGLSDIFPPVVLELLVVSIVSEIACLALLVFPVVWSLTSTSCCSFGRVVCCVCCSNEDVMKGPIAGVIMVAGV